MKCVHDGVISTKGRRRKKQHEMRMKENQKQRIIAFLFVLFPRGAGSCGGKAVRVCCWNGVDAYASC